MSRQKSLPAKEMSTTTQLGKVDWIRPKISRKPFIKETLPSYKQSEYGLFNENLEKEKITLNHQRKIGKGIDLSDMINSSYIVEKNNNKVNNQDIKERERIGVYMNPLRKDKLTQRNINMSGTNTLFKSDDGSPQEFLDKIENEAQMTSSPREGSSYDFTHENGMKKETLNASWLDGRPRKKQIGPNKNETSAAFMMGYNTKEKTVMDEIKKRNGSLGLNGRNNHRYSTMDSQNFPSSSHKLQTFQDKEALRENKAILLEAAEELLKKNPPKRKPKTKIKLKKKVATGRKKWT
uniref:Uncharacterized protein n=1 Tax=Euplotes crassus TaxID=5936 RepID=A0A7S3K959_EUPCR|mmetsp:Transcript_16084/g.15803  ORF Transcript_16084/g.15803 Transcript_16084/m.15803 type:complete len:293 (+) Transcript_16084:289-1167(+)